MELIYKILNTPNFACALSKSTLFGIPSWYQYLSGTSTSSGCTPLLGSISDIWLIVAAVIEILLRLAALAAVGVILYAGIEYTTSQGNPERTGRAMRTLIGAAVGLIICILSAAVVTYIAGIFK